MIKFQGDVGLGSAHRFNTRADAPVPDQFDAEPQRNSSEERDTRRSAHFRSSRPNYHRRRCTCTKRVHKRAEPPFLGEIYSRRWLEIICVRARTHKTGLMTPAACRASALDGHNKAPEWASTNDSASAPGTCFCCPCLLVENEDRARARTKTRVIWAFFAEHSAVKGQVEN
jgi:hypothetical protein